jgi:hypothetical protein
MTLPAALAVSVGPAIAKAILKVWLKDKTFLESVGESITDLICSQTKDAFAQKKAERQFQEIGDRIAQSLVPLFESDGAHLEENGKSAVALAVSETLEKTPITAQFILDRKLDPIEFAKHLLKARPGATIGLSEPETALYERIVAETSRYIVDMATQLPAFTEKTFAELIKKGDQLIETANRILEEVKKIREGSEQTNEITLKGSTRLTDYTPLEKLPNLQKIMLDMLRKDVVMPETLQEKVILDKQPNPPVIIVP